MDGLHYQRHAYDEFLTAMRGALEEVWGDATAGAGAEAAACDDQLPPGMRR
jgi:hypothetical protein